MSLNSYQNTYRKDIDGLRAISIILVLFYHLHLQFFQSGFLGVDIFFVISGFLITSHITQGIKENNFSFKTFYLKRARRILPALITVLMVTSVAAYFLFMPYDLNQFSGSLLATMGFYSNLYFWKTVATSYFAPNVLIMPLLHTWSLAIEEQFYILWPLFLYFSYKYISNFKVICLTSLIAIASLLFYILFHQHLVFVFYSPISRAFELLIGALLAINYERIKLPERKIYYHFLSLIGLVMILFSATMMPKNDFQSIAILIPCFGAIALIVTGKEKYPLGNKILSNPILVFIGLISYSLYLWHWPIIAFVHYFGIPLSLQNDTLIIVSSFLLSILTWKFIEQPARFKFKYGLTKTLFLSFIICIPELAFADFARYHSQDGFNKTPQNISKITSGFYGILKKKYGCFTLGHPQPLPSVNLCSIGDLTKKNPSVLLVGDSHAFVDVAMFNNLLKNAKLKGYVVTQASGAFLQGDILNWRVEKPMNRNNAIAQLIKTRHFKYVVLAGFWSFYGAQILSPKIKPTSNYAVLEYGLNNAVKMIESSGAIPVIVLDNPPLLNIQKMCGFSRITSKNCYNSVESIKKSHTGIFQTRTIILNLKKKYKNIILIDLQKAICHHSTCYSSMNGIPIYNTGHVNSHLNTEGSQLIGKFYLRKFGNPFCTSKTIVKE